MRCAESNKDFIVCDYNRDGDSFRSPWSNTYTPPLDDGERSDSALRESAAVDGRFRLADTPAYLCCTGQELCLPTS